ncbi:hypothetical protein FDA95_06475 [Clostridium botulinum]|nr:hypothetical protein [Clostridium botulinum]NFK78245.1 hypothetical protein [Clostridium botulinum]
MFYPELLKISKGKENFLAQELIDEIDNWLASLPDEVSQKITVSRFANVFNIDYSLARVILERLCELEVLKHMFAILCPNCNHVLKITDEMNLIEEMMNINFCYSCGNEEIYIESKDVEVRYKLIKKPKDPEKMKEICEDILGKEYTSEQDSIENLIKSSEYNVNKILYTPSEEDYKKLEQLFHGTSCKFKSTTEKGNSLEELVRAILNLVKCFNAIPARTPTNQIDAFVINKSPIQYILPGKIGDVFYCECKNEKNKPDNNYFHKLSSILTSSRSNVNEYRLGVVFSKEKCTRTCDIIAKKKYYIEKLFLVNFDLEELHEIVFHQSNFLDFLNYKISIIENDLIPSKELKEAYLY